MYRTTPAHGKSSAPWDRLRPAKQDPLESVGFVSKGDTRLLNAKTQESYYQQITARYTQFCAQHSQDLNDAFESLSLNANSTGNNTKQTPTTPPVTAQDTRLASSSHSAKSATISRSSNTAGQATPDPAEELSSILTALRKLREAILATSATAASPTFSQRVHVFNIRLAILALHPESYHASLRYLLTTLHNREHPLSASEVREMTSYLVLDTALRLDDFNEARIIQARAKGQWGFQDRIVETILRATVADDWPLFWSTRRSVDGYIRAIMHWRLAALRRAALNAIGKSYMKCPVEWILQSSTGGELTWEELVQKEDVGWLREGNVAIIRKPKPKT